MRSRGARSVRFGFASSASSGDRFSISVRGDGLELPPGFQPGKTKGLGMRIVTALIEQLGGALTFSALESGTEFVVTAPRNLPA